MMGNAISEANHQKFLNHLKASTTAVSVVADWLTRKGRTVQISGIHSSDSYDDRMNFTDEGDLFVLQRIEVKRRYFDFTCKNDWPYGDSIIVCAKHSWDNAIVKPSQYIMLNKNMTHAAIIPASTHRLWTVKTVKDSRYEGKEALQDCYFCPIHEVDFRKLA